MNITDGNAFRGGNGEGFTLSVFNRPGITDPSAFRGGNDDGFSLSVFNRVSLSDPGAFKGGNGDGFTVMNSSRSNLTDPNVFRGGNGDGFSLSVFNRPELTDPDAFKGGYGEGFTALRVDRANLTDPNAFRGGIDDGFSVSRFSQLRLTDPGVFKGGGGEGFTVSVYLKGSALPLTLVDFSGKWQDNTAVLSWQTVSETNTAQFILERSFTGDDFTDIGTVAASGNSSSLESYSYADVHVASLQPAASQFFYRLKSIDKDGNIYFSAIIILVRDGGGDLHIAFYPNPANVAVNISIEGLAADSGLTLTVRDIRGMLLIQKKITDNPEKLATCQLIPGEYIITIYSNDRVLKTVPVIIQH